jgi:histidinol-phosphatase (PHP family)
MKMLEIADMDILAHLDVPVRTGKLIVGYEPVRYEDQIRSILSKVIERNLALDVNTAGLRKAAQVLMPDPIILKWYAEMGGLHLTLGSDAHSTNQVGLQLEKAMQVIHDSGFSYITHYQLRKAHFESI